MPDINLLQNINSPRKELTKQSSGYLAYIGAGVFVIVLAITGILYYSVSHSQGQLTTISQQQAQAQNTLTSQPQYAQFVGDQAKLTYLNSLISNHLNWSKTTNSLDSVTLNTVYYSSVTLKQDGTATLNGYAPNFTELDKFIKALGDPTISPFVQSASLQNVTLASGPTSGINFTINITFGKGMWGQQ